MQSEKELKLSNNESNLKCLSFKTKQSRRIKKYSNLLQRDYDLSSSVTNSTSVLAVCNAGLATGLSREQLLELVLPFGPVKNVVLIPGKSSSFVEFYNEDVALQAYNNLQGKQAPLIKQGELFVTFVERAPEQQGKWTAAFPPGLAVLPDFVTSEEETQLLNCVDWKVADPQAGQALKHRRVRHYGYQFDYDTNNVNPDAPLSEGLPQACLAVVDKLRARGLVPWSPDQLTVNQYQPGQGIPPHVDTHSAFEDPILSLSLGADVVMEFRLGECHVPVLLPRRSLLIMAQEARYCWSHGITPRKSDIVPSSAGGVTLHHRGVRTSFTLRRLRRAPCACAYPQFCDSQRNLVQQELEEQAMQLEQLHVHQVYEEIACHFSDTRHSPWPNVRDFVLRQPAGCVVLDVGCGNGKYLGLNTLTYQVGCDSSVQLSKVCRERQHETFVCNCLQLPVCSDRVDCCLSIAVIHHLSTQERRLQALSEMCRVLRPGGCALVYVWARDQARGQVCSSYLKQASSSPHPEPLVANPFSLPVHTNRTQFAHPDLLVPWKLRPRRGEVAPPAGDSSAAGTVLYRYYHMFDEGELEALCGQVSGIQVQQSYYDQGNWCVIFKKL